MLQTTLVEAEAVEPVESKPGYLTTEFWLILLLNVLPELGAIDVGDTKIKGLIHVASIVGYALSRGLAKAGVPNVIPAASLTPVNNTFVGTAGEFVGDEDGPGDGEHPEVTAFPVTDSSADDDHDDSEAAGKRA
jgi:hypothetical protein